ncbi:glutamine-hydrolyzing carbamoyl-phosphate synthase small subunit [Wolbachia endosymbiont of Dirofilaria (Dirofilaria) immitis]|uniref:glutamine-hydrolyzing carbamoyl-phosphate synthase small subunit n=1 Tax=Wolbachia endosymbiont of Dirofilaria (Dirofilaria) immitis TaxID=1812115 RepID=UPI00158EC413|nr:glutamine-hydrolyzing carbamoyl-phosphate synthase small subunit [Wolbachia endosymbiont of Dirofilaria (Dirofilaria) immitis]QKX02155.1 glutamine-hydrolyzing carbamoyl-phosphate synthase small subunit [Wolbachia endosymbiont of Dirofilaria (Dirofilaria) immitis]
MQDAVLVLQSGKSFLGKSIGKKGKCVGEICFTTCATGYQHTITDPSFADQIIMFTFPHIGNIGINSKDSEGEKVFASGVIIRELSPASHPSSYISLNDWLEKNDVVGISGVDTRALTRYLRKHGYQNGMICSLTYPLGCNAGAYSNQAIQVIEDLSNELGEYKFINGMEIINVVSLSNDIDTPVVQIADTRAQSIEKYKVIIVDFGVKSSIVSRLVELGCIIKLIRPDKGFSQRILNMCPDGIVLSNGPGDPQKIGENIISEINVIIKSKIPILGICMGHQLLAIALGAKTTKMSVGHRGSNHPVYNVNSKKVEITSQNHGFVVDPYFLPRNVEVTHVSLFDNSIEGIMMKNYPVFSVQYHPEEAPGTHDSHYLFKYFINNIKLYKTKSI